MAITGIVKKNTLIALGILLAVSAFLYIFKKGSTVVLSNNVNKLEELVRDYQANSDIVPSSAAITELEENNYENEKKLKQLQGVFDSNKQELPENVSDKGIYLFESLHSTTKLLERKSTAKKMLMPPVDFLFDIPKEEDIPHLLKQIEMIDNVMGIVIEAGESEPESIVPQPLDKEEKVLDYNKVSIQITMKTDLNSFVKVLSSINRHIPLYLVEELSLKSAETDKSRVSFVVSRIITDVSLSDIEEFRNKNIYSLNTLFPLDLEFESFSERNPFFKYKQVTEGGPVAVGAAAPSAGKAKIVAQFTFKGSIYMKDKLTGIIKDNWQGKAYFVAVGDTCSGYKVLQIEDKKAILSKDDQEIILIKGGQ